MAEPDWPLAQPTTRFRMASVSKTVTSLAIFQLIQSTGLTLGHKLQDILALKTPAGGAPVDPAFGQITIQHLLENYGEIHACLPLLPSFTFATPPPSDTNFAACYSSEFPIDAAVVKQSWWRADFGMTLPYYDTSASTLAAFRSLPTSS